MTKNKTRRLFCNNCLFLTSHDCLYCLTDSEPVMSRGQRVDDWLHYWEVYKCRGCGSVSFRYYLSLGGDPDIATEEYYPPRIARKTPAWADDMPGEIQSYLTQVYAALHANSRWLVSCGVRSIVDSVIRDKVGDQNSFKDGIAELVGEGFIGKKEGDHLAVAIDAGSASIHRGYTPSEKETNKVMDIVEHLLQATYSLDAAAKIVKAHTPTRKKREPKKK